jgi:hypothetical protein
MVAVKCDECVVAPPASPVLDVVLAADGSVGEIPQRAGETCAAPLAGYAGNGCSALGVLSAPAGRIFQPALAIGSIRLPRRLLALISVLLVRPPLASAKFFARRLVPWQTDAHPKRSTIALSH